MGSFQIPARCFLQLAGLQGEFSLHDRGERIIGRGRLFGRLRGLDQCQREQRGNGDTNHCGHKHHTGRKIAALTSQQLSAST